MDNFYNNARLEHNTDSVQDIEDRDPSSASALTQVERKPVTCIPPRIIRLHFGIEPSDVESDGVVD